MNDKSKTDSAKFTELGNARSEEYTEKLLEFVREMEASTSEPFIPFLADIALARALIVHLVLQHGPKRGLAEARDAFNETFDQMKPILENIGQLKGQPPQ